ncbi:MAG: tRNA preQ1(34) S-adenosylmethionine ribosyltransferase-isomerase QueA [Proteobacteria bacterium]|nr:tRNA preQ1(34) S-adenosylmethionine ribosyltransferase-isomerase QueA [Pseudomonadota bacterium]MBU1710376.1 tRNA preQ1(34) S-adenosylmethionine ribosyltransferase-isomerase QueA [Pseudomonadota bacterium]
MNPLFDIEQYNYDLPEALIAQKPAGRRDESRLLVLDGVDGGMEDRNFSALPDLIGSGDLLVVNNTKVFPARLLGRKETGGKVELLILDYPRFDAEAGDSKGQVHVTGLVKSSKRPKKGSRLLFGSGLEGIVDTLHEDGKVTVELHFQGDFEEAIAEYGQMPLPPYINRDQGEAPFDRERYQTVFARQTGAVAAPTAGLHFTEELLSKVTRKGAAVANITLHVGYGTFAPVRVNDIRNHTIHSEYIEISPETADQVNEVKMAGGKVWAVGTTTVRALESAATAQGMLNAFQGLCNLYIYPGYQFRIVDNLVTNFHLPRSSLLFMVSALAGRNFVMQAYSHAVGKKYRFYSYGDAMAIIMKK